MPSRGRINTYFITVTAAYTLLQLYAPRRWRPYLATVVFGAELTATHTNYSAGIRF